MKDEQWVRIQESMTDEEREHLTDLHRNLADRRREYRDGVRDAEKAIAAYYGKLRERYCKGEL